MKKTPLYEAHLALGGKIIDFGGWALPVQYIGIIEEHQGVRNAAGLFDVSHMGEILVTGNGAKGYIQQLVTNDIQGCQPSQIIYSPMCYQNGGVVDDLLIYMINEENYLLVVNASNTEKDYQWMKSLLHPGVQIQNVSESYAQLAIQGPASERILQKISDADVSNLKFYHFIPAAKVAGVEVLISRTGYTGEDGFELYVPSMDGRRLWDALMEAGREDGLMPAGLGARDTLRFEAALPLYGQEISENISPYEAGLGKFVSPDKKEFVGRDALRGQQQEGLKRKLVGFRMRDRGIPRSHYSVESNGREIGWVTSGSYSPTFKENLGMALIDAQFALEGGVIQVVIRNKSLEAEIIKLPFYSKKYKKMRTFEKQ